MHYAYLLESAVAPREHYVGRTADLRTRFAAHNTGKSPHTTKPRPWNLVCYHAVADERRAFRRRHFGV